MEQLKSFVNCSLVTGGVLLLISLLLMYQVWNNTYSSRKIESIEKLVQTIGPLGLILVIFSGLLILLMQMPYSLK